MKSNQRHIDRARKKAVRNFGDNLIDIIQCHLNSKGFHFLTNQTIYNDKFTTPNKIRNPDLFLQLWKKHTVNLILEIDGNGSGNNVHGLDMESATDKTKSRNRDFVRANLNYIIIHVEELQTNSFYFKENKTQILELITYMISHELNKIITKELLYN